MNKISPLKELYLERELARKECSVIEDRLSAQWDYLSNNAGSLILNAAINGVLGAVGLKPKPGKSTSNNLLARPARYGNGFMSMMSTYYPLIWDIAQPLLWKLALNKFKSIFKKKKK